MKAEFTIGELSRCSGVNIETIRYYERIGLMPRPARTKGGRRLFDAEDLQTLAFIKRSREMCFSLRDIRSLLSLREDRRCADVKVIASRHLASVRSRVRLLLELEKTLAAAVDRCPGDMSADCSVLEVLEGNISRRVSA